MHAPLSLHPWLTIADLAARFRRHPRTIRDWIAHGCPTPDGLVRLPAAKLGKCWSVTPEDLARFEARVRPSPGRPALEASDAPGDGMQGSGG